MPNEPIVADEVEALLARVAVLEWERNTWDAAHTRQCQETRRQEARATAAEAKLSSETEENAKLTRQLRALAVALHRQHFAVRAPNWRPEDDAVGILSQIDNMTTGLVSAEEKAKLRAMVEELGQAKVTSTDVIVALREWFGGDRYARDWEYLDAQQGPHMRAMLEAVFADRRARSNLGGE